MDLLDVVLERARRLGPTKARPCRRIAGLLVVALAAILSGCPGNLEPVARFNGSDTNPLAFSAVDVNDREVEVGLPSDRVMVMFFSGEETSDAMQPITADIAVHFREADDLEFVTIVDLRSLTFYERPFADGAIRDAGARTIRRINRQLAEQGYDPIVGLDRHLYMVNDGDGQITETYQVPDPNERLTTVILDRHGNEIGRFDPATQLDEVIEAIERARNGLAQN